MRKWIFFIISSFLCKTSFLCAKIKHVVIPEGSLVESGLDPHFVAKFAFFIALLILWTTLVGKVLKMLFNIPIIAGQIISGVFLGPSFFNIKNLSIFADPFIAFDGATNALYTIASSDIFLIFVLMLSAAFTVPYLMWIAGHETDIQDILKVGFTAVTAGILGAVVPILLIGSTAYYAWGDYFNSTQAIGFGLVFAATSVSIPIAMLFAQKKIHLRSSKATLGAAIVDDILAVILLSVFFILIQSCILVAPAGLDIAHTHCQGIVQSLVYMFVAFVVIFIVGYYVIPPTIRLLKHKSQTYLISSVANGIMFLYFAFAELVGGLAGITGSYFAGLFHRMGDKRHAAEKVISPFVNAILLPIFLGSIGLQVDIHVLSGYHWVIVVVLLFVAIFSKMLACYSATLLSNLYRRKSKKGIWRTVDSYLFGSSMVARGEVGLVISTILRGAQVITPEQYVICVVVIVLTTIASPVMLSAGFYWLDKVEEKEEVVHKDVTINLGLFRVIGTYQMFNIIVGRLERSKIFHNSTIIFSEGRRIANLEGQNVKIIYSPDEGIIFKGNERKIKKILDLVKNSILSDIASVS